MGDKQDADMEDKNLQTEDENDDDDDPEAPMCPISMRVMKGQIAVTAAGQAYDPACLCRWLQQSSVDPVTGVTLWTKCLVVLPDRRGLQDTLTQVRAGVFPCMLLCGHLCTPTDDDVVRAMDMVLASVASLPGPWFRAAVAAAIPGWLCSPNRQVSAGALAMQIVAQVVLPAGTVPAVQYVDWFMGLEADVQEVVERSVVLALDLVVLGGRVISQPSLDMLRAVMKCGRWFRTETLARAAHVVLDVVVVDQMDDVCEIACDVLHAFDETEPCPDYMSLWRRVVLVQGARFLVVYLTAAGVLVDLCTMGFAALVEQSHLDTLLTMFTRYYSGSAHAMRAFTKALDAFAQAGEDGS
jgi:hypothetical protein